MRVPAIARLLEPALARRPHATAVIARSGPLTYADLDRAADAAAGALWELGVRPGDRVAACRRLRATYGLSEAPTVVAIAPAGGPHHRGASGRVLPHLAVAAYDQDGRRLEPGGTGELRVAAATTGPWAALWRPPL